MRSGDASHAVGHSGRGQQLPMMVLLTSWLIRRAITLGMLTIHHDGRSMGEKHAVVRASTSVF